MLCFKDINIRYSAYSEGSVVHCMLWNVLLRGQGGKHLSSATNQRLGWFWFVNQLPTSCRSVQSAQLLRKGDETLRNTNVVEVGTDVTSACSIYAATAG